MVKNGFKRPQMGQMGDKQPGLPQSGDIDGGFSKLNGGLPSPSYLGPPVSSGSGLLSLKTNLGGPISPSVSPAPPSPNLNYLTPTGPLPPVSDSNPSPLQANSLVGLKRVGTGVSPKPPDLA